MVISRISTLVKSTFGNDDEPVRRKGGSFSDRNPTPKAIGGPLTNLGEAATSFRLGLGGFLGGLYEGGRQVSGDVQDISGKTQEAIGKGFGALTDAPGAVIGGVTAPVGQLSKDILPLAAIAAAIVLLR